MTTIFKIIPMMDNTFNLTPAVPKFSKNPGPTCKPIMKTKRTRPNSCMNVRMSVGAVKPIWPAKIPAKSTKVTPSEIPPTFIFPNNTPVAMTIE